MHPQSQPAPRLTKLFNATLSEINAILKELPLLQQIDKRYSQGTNGKFTLILLVVVAVLILLELMGSTLSLLIVIYYPAIKSIKAIKSTSIVEYRRWTTFWFILTLTTVIRRPFDLLLGFLPYPDLWRMALFTYLFHPKTDGAYSVYVRVVKPLLKRFQKDKNSSRVPKPPGDSDERPRLSAEVKASVSPPSSIRRASQTSIKSN